MATTADELFQELTSVIEGALGEDNCEATTTQDVFADLAAWCHRQASELAREDAIEANNAYRALVRSRS